MEKNQDQIRVANLSREELERLEHFERELGYALVAYKDETASNTANKTSL
jgi:hypothetical protein